MELGIDRIEMLLLIAALVAMLARKFHFPYTVGLVLAGGLMSLLPFAPEISMTKDLIFMVLLPPLIFEAALFLPWKDLRKELAIIISMATVGVVLAAIVTTIGMHVLIGWPMISAAMFGVLISATDPVSVIATFKESGVGGRLRLLIEAESLFNDGTAAVLFGVMLSLAEGLTITPDHVVMQVILTVGGGILCGGSLALVMLFVAGKTTDHLIEITFTTVAAYGSFMFAEHFHWSGILATLTAGLVIGNGGYSGSISSKGRGAVVDFWEYIAFAANSLVFLLIGIHEIKQDFSGFWMTAMVAILLVTAGRAVAIYPIAWVFSRTPLKMRMSHQHLMFWGGLRGALALALALGLPSSIPLRDQIITAAFAVVAFSVIVQGITMTPLLRHLGELSTMADHERPDLKESG